jgi:hypothetical protein
MNSVSSALENPVCVHYKDQPVLAAQGSNWYYCENCMTHKDRCVCHNTVFINVAVTDTYRYHWSSRD